MRWRYSPIDVWPGALRPASARRSSNFRVGWDKALADLEREVEMLRGREPTIRLALEETEIRRDGLPRAGAKPRHPGVIIEFTTSTLGRLSYASDVYADTSYGWLLGGWRANVRAITLGLEALRAVDRHGIGRGGEQYQGFKAIRAGSTALGAATMTVEEAAAFVAKVSNDPNLGGFEVLQQWAEYGDRYFRAAAKEAHPDAGGDAALFRRLQEAKAVLDSHGGQR